MAISTADAGSTIAQTNSIFQQPWWLDAVAPQRWHEVVVQKAGELVGRLPYVVKRKYGLTLLTMPQLTQTIGPWIATTDAKYTNQLSQQLQIGDQLIRGLPRHDLFLQNFSPSVSNWLSFHWAGFRASLNYTYRLEDLTNLDLVWAQFRENTRREIRKAEKHVQVRDDLGVEAFLRIGNQTFLRQGMRVPYDLDLVRRLDQACARHQARRIYFAEDAKGNVHAAAYIVWDAHAAYYLLGGSDPALRRSGAMSLLLWEAIKFAASVTSCFDFEGSMLEPIERFFRSFGARQVSYLQLSHASRRMEVLLGAAQIGAALTARSAGRSIPI